jgi:MoaA/NifB/PqqE/SkfB family radical SAM enzyme
MIENEINSIGFALAPDNVPSFLLDWEVTKRCNLDCSYCGTGVDGGHDNSTDHPPLADCLKTIDFMYEYVSLYIQNKKPTQRKVILNVYGGESLFHPNIIEILTAAREKYKPYADQWHLTITTTTNAVVNKSIWKKIILLIDEFTISYHAENLPKQERLFFDNLIETKNQNKRVKCVVMMHTRPELWDKSLNAVEFCKTNNIKYIPKPFDSDKTLMYNNEQFDYLKNHWAESSNLVNLKSYKERLNNIKIQDKTFTLCEGRACCGGRKLSLNNDLKSSVVYVPRQGFKDWYCSVNWFFLFVQQLTGNVYTNKDCRMRFDGTIGPIGNMNNYDEILTTLKQQFDSKSMPVIRCAKSICMCGYCAPKAESLDNFKDLINRNVITDVIKYE